MNAVPTSSSSGSKDAFPLLHPYLPSLLTFAQNSHSNSSISSDSNPFSLTLAEYSSNDLPIDKSSIHIISTFKTPFPINCMEWNPNPIPFHSSIRGKFHSFDNLNAISPGLLAVGSTTGAVSLINWVNIESKENIEVEERQLCSNSQSNVKDGEKERGPGSCCAVSWNRLNCGQLAAGFENLKSDNCVLIWDLEHTPTSKMFGAASDVYLRLCSGESASSISWLPESPFLLAVGTSMGLVRVFDIRGRGLSANIANSADQQSSHSQSPPVTPILPSAQTMQPIFSLWTHTGQRPRKVRRILPDPNRPSVFATFSDVAGDAVKLWDLASYPVQNVPPIAGASTSSTSAPVLASSVPSSGGVTPSFLPSFTIQPRGLNASTMTSISSSVSVVDASWVCSRPGLLALALSGQRGVQIYATSSSSSSSLPSSVSSTSSSASNSTATGSSQVPVLVLSTAEPVQAVNWLGSDLRTYLTCGDTGQAAPWLLDSLVITTLHPSNSLSSSSAGSGSFGRTAVHRAHPGGVLSWQLQRVRCRERVPLAISSSSSGSVAVALTKRSGVGFEERPALRANDSDDHDLTRSIQRRARLKYSLEAFDNQEVIEGELNQLFAALKEQETFDYSPLINQLLTAYNVWAWIERVESKQQYVSFRKCGALDILGSDISHPSLLKETTFIFGIERFVSKEREQLRTFCGWEGDALLQSLVEGLEEQNYFEKAAAIALWYGNLPLAIRVLQSAVESAGDENSSKENDESNSKKSLSDPGKEQAEWDSVATRPYLQVVNLAAVCIAGFSPVPSIPHVQGQSESAKARSATQQQQVSSWVAMSKSILAKIERFTFQRRSASYLSACLLFLLHAQGQQGASGQGFFQEIIENENIFLEDRIAFAASFLPTAQCIAWLEQQKLLYKQSGQLDGLLITGFTNDGLEILQQNLDLHGDIQIVALLATRLIDNLFSESTASVPALASADVSTTTPSPAKPLREFIWLHEYRQLLNRSELFIERASLDVALSHRCRQLQQQRERASQTSLSASNNPPSTSSTPASAYGSNNGRGNLGSRRFGSAGTMSSSSSLSMDGGTSNAAGKAPISSANNKSKRTAYSLPRSSNFAHVFLRCPFCGVTLPVDPLVKGLLRESRMSQLQRDKSTIGTCGSCAKQLPKCYVCQLNINMINPYSERTMIANRNRVEALTEAELAERTNWRENKQIAKKTSLTDAAKPEHNTMGLSRWLFFCQSCRHGGHMECIEDWFAERVLELSSSSEPKVVSRRQCGVNGCSCNCIAR